MYAISTGQFPFAVFLKIFDNVYKTVSTNDYYYTKFSHCHRIECANFKQSAVDIS